MPRNNYKHTEETKRKISLARKGKSIKMPPFSEEHKRKLSEIAKHRVCSDETRKKMSETRKGRKAWNKGVPHSEKAKKKISEALKGRNNHFFGKHHSEEAKKIMSELKKGRKLSVEHRNKLTGRKDSSETRGKRRLSHLGKKHTDETKKKIGRKGEKHHSWKGGISKDRKAYSKICNNSRRARKNGNGGTYTAKEWEYLKEKYGYMCPACGKAEPEVMLTVDHIIPIAMGGSNYIDNIQPLCKSCNCRKHIKIIKYEPHSLKLCA